MSEELSTILSNLDISDINIEDVSIDQSLEVDSLLNFKEEFAQFLANNPEIVKISEDLPNSSKSLVVLSPLSVKHSFGRKWVSKSYHSTIVERPQRLLAVSIGIASALSIYPSNFTLLVSEKKSSLSSPHVLKIHGENWPKELEQLCIDSFNKLSKGEIEVPNDWHSGDIYLVKETIDALEGVIGSIETAIDTIFKLNENNPKRAFVAIRPPGHHSHRCAPSGFCLINNAHIATQYAFNTKNVTHAVILDFDLHHGDGTQDICWMKSGFSENDEDDKKESVLPKIGYFSLHDINSYPTELGYASVENIKNASTCILNAHDLNIWNIHLEKYNDEEDFYKIYNRKYSKIFEKAEEFLKNSSKESNNLPFKPIIIISAGFDASEHELKTMQRHEVSVPTSFYNRFTSDAVNLADKYSNGILLSLLEGGYSDSALTSGVFSHLIGLQKQNWNNEWGSSFVTKELVKGCKPNWKSSKVNSKDCLKNIKSFESDQSDFKNWSNQVIKLGRNMIPEFIINQTTVTPNTIPDSESISSRALRSRSLNAEVKKEEYEFEEHDTFEKIKLKKKQDDNMILDSPYKKKFDNK